MADEALGNYLQHQTPEEAISDAFEDNTDNVENDAKETSKADADMTINELELAGINNGGSKDDDENETKYKPVIAIQEYKYDSELEQRQISRNKRAMTYTTIPISVYTEEEDYNREMPFYVCVAILGFCLCFFFVFFFFLVV